MKIFSKLIVLGGCLLALAPFVWHIASSFKGSAEIARIPPTFLPAHPTLVNYIDLISRRPFLAYCFNSFVIASLASLLCVAAASLAAYRLARSTTRLRTLVSSLLLGLAFFP